MKIIQENSRYAREVTAGEAAVFMKDKNTSDDENIESKSKKKK